MRWIVRRLKVRNNGRAVISGVIYQFFLGEVLKNFNLVGVLRLGGALEYDVLARRDLNGVDHGLVLRTGLARSTGEQLLSLTDHDSASSARRKRPLLVQEGTQSGLYRDLREYPCSRSQS